VIILKTFIITVFFTVFVSSQVLPSFIGWRETFPLFHWSLFSTTQGEYWQYVIVFPHENCEVQNCSFFKKSERNEDVPRLIEKIGRSYEAKSPELSQLINQFEQIVIPLNKSYEYELRLRKSDPVDLLLYGKFLKEITLVKFSAEKI